MTWDHARVCILKSKVYEKLGAIRKDLRRLRDAKVLFDSTLLEISLRERLAKSNWDELIELNHLIRANRFYWDNISSVFLLITDSIKQVKYASEEIHAFRKFYLGENKLTETNIEPLRQLTQQSIS